LSQTVKAKLPFLSAAHSTGLWKLPLVCPDPHFSQDGGGMSGACSGHMLLLSSMLPREALRALSCVLSFPASCTRLLTMLVWQFWSPVPGVQTYPSHRVVTDNHERKHTQSATPKPSRPSNNIHVC